MSSKRVKRNRGQQWLDIAQALDALGSATDLSAFAQQYHKLQQLSRDKDSLPAAPFYPKLLTKLTQVVSSALLLVHQLHPGRMQQLPPAAAGCFFCCMDTYCHLVKAGTTGGRALQQLRKDIAESGQRLEHPSRVLIQPTACIYSSCCTSVVPDLEAALLQS